MPGQVSTAKVVSDRDGSGFDWRSLSSWRDHEGRHPSGLSNSAALGRPRETPNTWRTTEAFMKIMLRRVLLPRVVVCCCRYTDYQWALPLLQGLWALRPCGKETLAASEHVVPREQVKKRIG